MPTMEETRAQLNALRAQLVQPYKDAKAQGDRAKMDRLTAVAGEIDDALDDLAILGLLTVAARLDELRAKVEAATRIAEAWPFGGSEAPVDHERPFREELEENDFEDGGPNAPPPQPAFVSPETVPTVSPDWAENYTGLWNSMTIRPEWKATATAIAQKIVTNQGRYASAVAGTSVPWWFVAVVHAMECSLRFDQHLHNGDPLTARTVREPKGRPPAGGPRFTWEESARDSIVYEKLDKVTDWSLPSALYHWPKDQPADAAEPIDTYFNCHVSILHCYVAPRRPWGVGMAS